MLCSNEALIKKTKEPFLIKKNYKQTRTNSAFEKSLNIEKLFPVARIG
jgi:hypothetical protein